MTVDGMSFLEVITAQCSSTLPTDVYQISCELGV